MRKTVMVAGILGLSAVTTPLPAEARIRGFDSLSLAVWAQLSRIGVLSVRVRPRLRLLRLWPRLIRHPPPLTITATMCPIAGAATPPQTLHRRGPFVPYAIRKSRPILTIHRRRSADRMPGVDQAPSRRICALASSPSALSNAWEKDASLAQS